MTKTKPKTKNVKHPKPTHQHTKLEVDWNKVKTPDNTTSIGRVTVAWDKPKRNGTVNHETLEAALFGIKELLGEKFTIRVKSESLVEFQSCHNGGTISIKP